MKTERHHIVQKKYLAQWVKAETGNQLNIYIISENNYDKKGPDWKGFWRKNYNIFDKEKEQYFLPEKVTQKIDGVGIEVIRKINATLQTQLDDYERSYLAFYIALQYFRTPRYREETDKFFEQIIKKLMREDISSPEKVRIKKEDILKEAPKNDKDKATLEKIEKMSEVELNKEVFDFLHSDDYKITLTKTGHSKQILKIDKYAKKIFELQWLFLKAPKGTFFATSDNPCFTFSISRFHQGLLSPNVLILFPLRPDLCITIKPNLKSYTERYINLDKKMVRHINKLILENSYKLFISRDKEQLDYITKNYDYNKHRESRDTVIYKNGDYTMFNLE